MLLPRGITAVADLISFVLIDDHRKPRAKHFAKHGNLQKLSTQLPVLTLLKIFSPLIYVPVRI
jgi:hypothetical protein